MTKAKTATNKKPAPEANMVVLPITGGVDVFVGTGWDNWSRFETTGGYPKLVAGAALVDKDYRTLYARVQGGR